MLNKLMKKIFNAASKKKVEDNKSRKSAKKIIDHKSKVNVSGAIRG